MPEHCSKIPLILEFTSILICAHIKSITLFLKHFKYIKSNGRARPNILGSNGNVRPNNIGFCGRARPNNIGSGGRARPNILWSSAQAMSFSGIQDVYHVNDNFTPIAYLIITLVFFQEKLYHYIILIHKYLYLDKQQKMNSKTTSSFSL